jgi:molybdenum-dependent DNA-binding transcriptional regulator ModE
VTGRRRARAASAGAPAERPPARGPGAGRGSRAGQVLGPVGALDLALLGMVVLVADLGSISAAAARLGYSQPGLSNQVKAVERALGYPLFHRHPGGVRLNRVGALVIPYARSLLAVAETMVGEINRATATAPHCETPHGDTTKAYHQDVTA